jgi:hypothetical protein
MAHFTQPVLPPALVFHEILARISRTGPSQRAATLILKYSVPRSDPALYLSPEENDSVTNHFLFLDKNTSENVHELHLEVGINGKTPFA